MPEFRRGLGRWLPQAAERDLFHPSLEDLRAQNVRGWRLGLRTLTLWLDCWRVWLLNPFDSRQRSGRALSLAQDGPSARRNYFAMFIQDVRRAFRIFRLEPGFTAAAGPDAGAWHWREHRALRRRRGGAAAAAAGEQRRRDRDPAASRHQHRAYQGVPRHRRSDRPEGPDADAAEPDRYGNVQATLFEGEEPTRLAGLSATPALLDTLQVQPALGRLISADDIRNGAPPVVMISYDLWQTRFGSDPNIIGRGIQFVATRRQVIGVLPQGFHFPPNAATDIATPLVLSPVPPANRKNGWVAAMARLTPGQSIASVRAELDTLSREFAEKYPEQNRGTQYYAESLRDALVGDTKRPLLLLLGAVGFVLLIACVNVGNLLLARSLGRRQEMAVRTALGAGWTRLAAQIFTEGMVLAITGGLAGVILAWQAAPALAALVPATAQVPGLKSVGINVPVMLFSLGVSLLSALLFSAVSCVGLASAQQRAALASTRGTSMAVGRDARPRCSSRAKWRWRESCSSAPG